MTRFGAPAVLLVALFGSGLFGAMAAKPGTPGAQWFAGRYDRVGRDTAGQLLNDQVAITPFGDGLQITACARSDSGIPDSGGPDNGGPDSILSFGPAFEIVNLLTGQRGQTAISCLFHNNGYSRPILTCQVEDGAAFTLWPQTSAQSPIC